MKTKFISVLLTLSMAAVYLFSVPAFAEETKFSGGSGTQDDPYLISTAEDMWELSNDCKSGSRYEKKYASKYFKMTEDIDLGCSTAKQWIPIGNYDGRVYFSGDFNGDGHTITGLYIDNSAQSQGLFGSTSQSTVQNLTVEGTVKGGSRVAGITAYSMSGITINNCSFKGTVYAKDGYAGGIAAYVYDGGNLKNCTNEATVTAGGERVGGVAGNGYCNISGCKNMGKVKGANYVAGISGCSAETLTDGTISDCYNTGAITGIGKRIGGIVGQYYLRGSVTRCYNTGDINGGSEVGGIVGDHSPDRTVSLCFNTGNISGGSEIGGISGEMCNGGVVKNCYNLGDVSAMTNSAGGIVGYYWSGSAGNSGNTRIESAYNTGTVTASSSYDSIIGFTRNGSIVVNTVYLQGSCSENKYGTEVTKGQLANTATYSSWNSFDSIWQIPAALGRPILLNPEETVKIATADDMCKLYENVQKGNTYKNIYIELTDDIDFDGYDWIPIGSYDTDEDSARPFLGIFNGNGHTISNLNCDAGSEEYQGLFGYVGTGGQVRNVIMDDSCFFSAGEHTAAIAALNAGTIENCKNYAEVIGDEFTGGIAGENQNGGLITKCYNAGTITSTASEVGGIVGYNIEATVSECVNDGSVDADVSFSGGIVGQNHTGTIENSYNTGEIKAVRAYTGGVVGQSIGSGAKVSNCYSTGRVYSYEISGGVAGSNKNSSVIEKCYYLEDMADGGISGDNSPRSAADIAGSAEKLTEAQFANQSSFSGWDFDNVWLLGDRPLLEFGLVLKGKGTEEEPYLIGSAGDLSTMRALVNNGKTKAGVHYLLTNDIDLENKEVMPIGCDFYFYGIFDGGGHKITGFTIRNITMSNNGLFGGVSIGVIKNLRVEGDIDIKTSKPYGSFNIGGIVGVNNGTIENCSFSGSVKNSTNIFSYIGGIAGKNEKGTISDCYFEGELDAILANGNSSEGGIAGANYNATITRSYNSGDISGGASAGGITGYNYSFDGSSSISNCYNTGSVSVKKDDGKAAGIVGDWYLTQTSSKNEITSCYNTGKISGTNAYAIITEDNKRTLEPTVTYCYYLTGTGNDSSNSNEMTAKHFASGLVAYMLQNDDYGMIWGQRLKGESKDASPILTSDTNKSVHRINYETDDNSRYATGYATGEGIGELPTVPSTSTRTFVGWSLSQRNFSNLLTEDTPITKDVYAYAVSQEMYGETDSDKTVQINYGRGGSVDLSQYIVYQNGSSTNGKYTYTINSGNDALNAAISGDMLTIPTSAPVGTYNLSVTATEKTPNISLMSVSFDNLPVTMNITVIVGKRDAEITAPKAKLLTYNGSEQELVTAGATSGGTFMYSLDGNNYSSDIPKGKNVGGYTVYYRLEGGDEYNDISAETVSVTINKAIPQIDTPVPEAAAYGTKLSDIELPENWRWKDDSVMPTVKNSGYEAEYTVSDTANYDWSGVSGYDNKTQTVSRTVKPVILKANPVITPPKGRSLKTTGEYQELIVQGQTNGGTLVYSLDGTNYSAEIPKAKDKGNYTVYYKVIGGDNYNDTLPQTVTAELGKMDIPEKEIKYPQAVKNLEYNGNEQELVTEGETIDGTKFLYSLDNKTYSEEIPKAVNAGSYAVYYKVDGGEQYNDIPARRINVAIAKQNPRTDVLTKALDLYSKVESQNLVYGIKLSDIELTKYFEWVEGSVVPEVDYAYQNGYPAIMHVEDDENYDWDGVEGYDKDKNMWFIDLPFELGKAAITVMTDPKAKSLTYTGYAQELVTSGSAEGGTIEYSLNGTDYSDTVPVGTNAGDYTVYYKAAGDSNHNDTEAKTVKVTIAKKAPELIVPDVSGRRVTYGAKLSEISLPDGWSWVNGDDVPTVKNNGYAARINIDYDENYDWESIEGYNSTAHTVTRTLAVSVDKAPSDEVAPENISAIYGDTLAEIMLPSGWTWDDPSQSVGNVGVHLFAATYTPEDPDNYNGIKTNISVEVRKANPVVTAPEAKEITYTGLAQELVTAASTTGGTLLYSLDGDNYFTAIPKGRAVGEYTVRYAVEGDGNYNGVEEQTVNVTIKKATPSLTVSMQSWTLGGTAPDPVISGNISGGEVTYEYKAKDATDSAYTASKPDMDGEFTVRATVAETENYNSATAKADFTVSKPEGAPIANILTYNGEEQELVTAENTDFFYSLDGENYSSEIPKAVNAGVYTVYYKIGSSSPQTLEVTILQKPVTLETPEIPNTVTYGTHLYEILLGDGWGWADGDIIPEVNNIGYEAVYSIKADEEDESYKNYAWSNVEGFDEKTLTVRRVTNVTVQKVDVTVTLPRVKMRTYTGMEQELITAGSVRGGQILYSLDNTEYSTNVPTAVNAGAYTVYYKIIGDSNHNDGEAGNISVTIFPQDAVLVMPQPESVVYGTKLSEIPLDGGWVWTDENTVPEVNNNGYEARYTVVDNYNPNYSWLRVEGYNSETQTVTRRIPLTVTKASTTVDIPQDITATYGNKLSDITLPDGWEWANNSESVGNAGIRTFTAIYTPADSKNYETLQTDITVTVGKAQSKVGEPEIKTLVYTGTKQELISAPEATGGTLLYSLDGNNYSNAVPSEKNAGDYTVYYKLKGDENHLDTEPRTITSSIAKANMLLEVILLGWYEGGEASSPIVYGNTGSGEVKYEYKSKNGDDSEYSGDMPDRRGLYKIRATAAETENYNGASAESDFFILPPMPPEDYSLMFIDRVLLVSVPKSGQYSVILASYKDDRLQSVHTEKMIFDAAGANVTILPEQLTEDGSNEIKAMLWNNMTDMRPQCETVTWSGYGEVDANIP